jgi:hypothetical protein
VQAMSRAFISIYLRRGRCCCCCSTVHYV